MLLDEILNFAWFSHRQALKIYSIDNILAINNHDLWNMLNSICSIFRFLWSVVCLFIPFVLAIVLSVLRFTNCDYLFGIFKLFLLLLTRKLLNQGFVVVNLKSSFRKFYLVNRYRISVSQTTMDMLRLSFGNQKQLIEWQTIHWMKSIFDHSLYEDAFNNY